jgi:hypothetical protein
MKENENSSNCYSYVDTYYQMKINLTFNFANENVDICV